MNTKREHFHSATLDESKCKGCTNCIKNCPTEAIRVRKGKAVIITERCIDCGECIRVCPHHAKMSVSDEPALISGYERAAALPAPSLYGQFGDISPDAVLSGLLSLGFDAVYEVALAADTVSQLTAELLAEGSIPKPVISSSCGAPSCRALAEDIVRGGADKTDCIFVLRNEIRHLTLEMVRLEEKLPPSLDRGDNGEKR